MLPNQYKITKKCKILADHLHEIWELALVTVASKVKFK